MGGVWAFGDLFCVSSSVTESLAYIPQESVLCAKARRVPLLFGGVSPVAGQMNVFANRTALLVARDAWCADPTAALSSGLAA